MVDRPSLPVVPEAYDWERFRRDAKKTVDDVADYYRDLAQQGADNGPLHSKFPVQATVKPGYLAPLLPSAVPEKAADWDTVRKEVRDKFLPGVTHWQHPNFYAFFPAMASPPAMLGELMSNAMNQPGFNWVCSPVASELEVVVSDWLAELFFADSALRFQWKGGEGGGVMQPSATEAMVVAMLAAQTRAVRHETPAVVGHHAPRFDDDHDDPVAAAGAQGRAPDATEVRSRLVAYYSDQAHFAVEKAARVLSIPYVRKIPSKQVGPVAAGTLPNAALDVEALRRQMDDDRRRGLLPFFVSVNFGATGTCAVDPIADVAALLKAQRSRCPVWLNVDAAYAGSAAICPELRPLAAGWELADTVLINGSKWMSTLFNTNYMFFQRAREDIVSSLNQTGVYLQNAQTASGSVVDFKDYHLGLGRPFRALKVYTTLRSFGAEGLRATIRRHVVLAQYLSRLLLQSGDPTFAVVPPQFGLLCLRLLLPGRSAAAVAAANMALLEAANARRDAFLVHTVAIDGLPVLRVAFAHPQLGTADVEKLAQILIDAARRIVAAPPASSKL